MSSVPPQMPPGGGVPPPYDPKMQWRVYREQQRAAWRAQRDAWRAQRRAWKGNYVGVYGPRVPSVVGPVILICVGVIALLMVTGRHRDDAGKALPDRRVPLALRGPGRLPVPYRLLSRYGYVGGGGGRCREGHYESMNLVEESLLLQIWR